MEYYPIYSAIKNWTQKNIFLAMSIISVLISLVFFINVHNKNLFVAGSSYQQKLLEAGHQEIIFSFDKDMISFGSHETNALQWQELMDLKITPPQKGSIRSISGNSFAYIFDNAVPASTTLKIDYNTNLTAKNGTPAQLRINYQESLQSPFTLEAKYPTVNYASRHSDDLTTPIILQADMPILLKSLKKALSIQNQDNKKHWFRISYEVVTNKQYSAISYIHTNYNTIKVYPYFLKKHQQYKLNIDYSKLSPNSSKENFSYNFNTYEAPQWLGTSQTAYNSSSKSEFEVTKPFWIFHNTRLQNQQNSSSLIESTPAVSNLKYTISGKQIEISGDFKSNQEYQIKFTPIGLNDIYKQKITNTFTTNITFISQKPQLAQVEGVLYIDRKNPIVRYQTLNVTNVKIYYQLINSAYYTALSLYGRTIPTITYHTNITIDSPLDQITWQEFDLSKFFSNTTTMMVHLNIQNADEPTSEYEFTKVLATSSSLTAHISTDDLLLQAKKIETQEPLELMMVSIWDPVRGSFQDLGRTKSDGSLRIPNPRLPLKSIEKPIFIGIFEDRKLFKNIAFLSGETSYFNGINGSSYLYNSAELMYNDITTSEQINATISTDRPNYKIDENVFVHALARGKMDNHLSTRTSFFNVSSLVTVLDPQHNTITNFYRRWSSTGSINFQIDNKQIKQVGTYIIQIKNTAHDFFAQQTFQVESITPKNTEIAFKSKKPSYVFGDTLDISLHPRFLFGENITSDITYDITGTPIPFYSKQYSMYSFGDYTQYNKTSLAILGTGATSSKKPVLDIHKKLIEKSGNNLQLNISAKTTSDSTDPIFLENNDIAVYQPYQLGIYTEKSAVTNYEPITLDLIIIDPIDEKIVTDPVFSKVTITKQSKIKLGIFSFITNIIPLKSSYKKQVYQENILTSQAQINFIPKEEGLYYVTYSIFANNTQLRSTLTFSVLGEDQLPMENEILSMKLDKPIYESGEKAFLYINNPFPKSHLLLTIERDTIREFHTIKTTNSIITHPIVLTYQDEPGLNISAVLTSISNENTPNKILYGDIYIPMNPVNKKLQVLANTSKSNYMPQEEITINISAFNSFNQGIEGEAFVVVRDKAVLDNSSDSITEPLDFFYKVRRQGFTTWDSTKAYLQFLTLTNKPNNKVTPYAHGLARAYSQDTGIAYDEPTVRSNFPFTLYSDVIKLSKDKISSITFKLPDNISEFDVSILAYDENQLFGKTNISFTSSKQLIIDDSLPLFVRPNDKMIWGAHIRNLTASVIDTQVKLKSQNTFLSKNQKIAPHSSIFISNTTLITNSNNVWCIEAISKDYQDKVAKTLPIIYDNPWISTSYSGELKNNKSTNINLKIEDSSKHQLQIQVANTPILNIKEQLRQLLEIQTLSIDYISERLLVFLGNEDLIIDNNWIDLNKEELRTLLQKDIDQLKNYYSTTERIMTIPNSKMFSYDPLDRLKLYEILITARKNNYIIDKTLYTSLEKITKTLSKQYHSSAQAYAVNLLAINNLLDKESFLGMYRRLPNTIDSQALILDTMYKLGVPLGDISEQTLAVTKFISETGNEILIPKANRFNANALISYYGSYKDSIKILNYMSNQNDFIHTALAFSKKHKEYITPLKAYIQVDKQDFTLTEMSNTIYVDIKKDSDIQISSLDNSPIFYNIVYKYIPKHPVSKIDNGYSIAVNIFDSNNTHIDKTLEKDTVYDYELTITPKNESSQQLEIIVPTYAGVTFLPDQTIANASYVAQDDKIFFYTKVNQTYKLRFKVTATHFGQWTSAPISVSSISSPDLFGVQSQEPLTVK